MMYCIVSVREIKQVPPVIILFPCHFVGIFAVDVSGLVFEPPSPCFLGEVKTLMVQLLRAVHHLHDNWILHRDLKASNLLLSHKGILKVRMIIKKLAPEMVTYGSIFDS